MSLLTEVAPEAATGTVAEIYKMAEEMMGAIPNGIKVHSVNPAMMKMFWDYLGYVMNHPTLSGELFTCIRMLVSIQYKCEYCIRLNEGMLMNMSGYTAEQIAEIKIDPMNAPLTDKEKALLAYVIEATEDANAVGANEVDKLRREGCTDMEIYDALRHGANQVMGDILLNAFKVELD